MSRRMSVLPLFWQRGCGRRDAWLATQWYRESTPSTGGQRWPLFRRYHKVVAFIGSEIAYRASG
eukprot:1041576-Pleurochrysis_carterae.AAC.1